MHLDIRDYRFITDSERNELEKVREREHTSRKYGTINYYNDYPEAAKHYLSLFPNNHIVLFDMKKQRDLHEINLDFYKLVHAEGTTERSILSFVNHKPKAYHIVGSIFTAGGFTFGHHCAFLFPEFALGKDYRADYLLVGKGSGGYEFVFIEFERPNGYVTLKSGNPGKTIRDGDYQVKDWKPWVDASFTQLTSFFNKEKNPCISLPEEFQKFDNTRVHYVVVAGTRDEYKEKTYYRRRELKKESDILILHYDNLFDASELLLERNTF